MNKRIHRVIVNLALVIASKCSLFMYSILTFKIWVLLTLLWIEKVQNPLKLCLKCSVFLVISHFLNSLCIISLSYFKWNLSHSKISYLLVCFSYLVCEKLEYLNGIIIWMNITWTIILPILVTLFTRKFRERILQRCWIITTTMNLIWSTKIKLS